MDSSFPRTHQTYHPYVEHASITGELLRTPTVSVEVRPSPPSPAHWADEAQLTYAERLVLLDLVVRAEPVAGVRKWARCLGLHDRTVRAALERLQALGVVDTHQPGPGMPTYVRLTAPPVAEVPTPPAARRSHSVAEVLTPPATETPHPPAHVPSPLAEITYLPTPLKEVKEDFFLREVSQHLTAPQYEDFWLARNAGGRVTLGRLLADLGSRTAPERAVRDVTTPPPGPDVQSALAYFITRARAVLAGAAAQPTPTRPTTADYPELEAARAFAVVQASSLRSPHEAESLRRGIELEFAGDPAARDAALRAFDEAVAS